MRILISNSTLALRGGTEAYTQDLVRALRSAGHDIAVYSPIIGEVGLELRAAGVTVLEDLGNSPWVPDILHCHHNTETMTALLHFPSSPAVFVSHGWTGWLDAPVRHPRIYGYVAVDGPTRERLLQYGISAERTRLVPNFIDLARFVPRGSLPVKPGRALVLSHYARMNTHVPVVQEACRRRNLALDVVGYGVGRPELHPEKILGRYDIVFAKGRAALEAVVTGVAVVVCDAFGVGPMVTTRNIGVLRTLEGDYMQWYSPLGAGALEREIDRYDPGDVAELTRWIRSVAGVEMAVPQLVNLYTAARAEHAERDADVTAEGHAAAAYLRWLSIHIKERLIERDPLAGLAVRLRNRLARVPFLASIVLRASALIQRRWPARSSPGHGKTVETTQHDRVTPRR